MGIEIKLTEREFPITPYFIDFLHGYLKKQEVTSDWHDQLKESGNNQQAEIIKRANTSLADIARNPLAIQAINRSYDLFAAILTGATDRLTHIHNRYKFIAVVGIPRSGGSYLTKVLFTALNMDASKVPSVIAHDGFPDLAPFYLTKNYNLHTAMTRRMAEYLVMTGLYFAQSKSFDNRIIVPKKASKAAYQGAFFNRMLGPETEYIVTLRHPIPSCISTYEKSGGLPKDGRFAPRSAIEIWAARDNVFTSGEPDSAILDKDYFDVYLKFWEQYHFNLALTGLSVNRNWTVVPYTEAAMSKEAQNIHTRFDFKSPVEPFHVFNKRDRHPEWNSKAEASILRVHNLWQAIGLQFPVDEIMQAW